MVKYSYEFKKKVVLAYISDEDGAKYLAEKCDITHKSSIDVWVKNYKEFGDQRLLRSRENDA